MPGCSNTLFCWLDAHPLVVWVLCSVAVLVVLGEAIYVGRCIRESRREMKEVQQFREEKDREWKVWRHRVQSVIRQGEEWEIDVSDLKTSMQRLTLMRKAARAISYEKALCFLPAMPLIVLSTLGAWFPTRWMFIILLIVLGLSLLWSAYHGWKWYRYRWFFKVLDQREITVEKD